MMDSQQPAAAREKGLCVLDSRRQVLFANEALAALLGLGGAGELLGQSIDTFFDAQSRDCLKRSESVPAPADPMRVTLLPCNARPLPAYLACHNFHGDAATFAGAVLILTRRSLGESSEQDLSDQLEVALEAGELGAWSLDLRTGKAWRTELHDRIFGYENKLPDWSYETFIEHVIDSDQVRVKQSLADAMDAGRPWEFECRIRRADGALRWIWAQGRLQRDVQGESLGLFGVIRDISARKAAEEQIEFLAYYDPLTRLPNRRLMTDRLGQAVRAAARHKLAGAIFFIDLDDFKTLNDTLGHHTGDQMLLEVARRLLSCLRAQDTVARFGGDEFVVMMEGLGDSQAAIVNAVQQVADKILESIEGPYDFSVLRHRRTTCSIGVAIFGSTHDTPDALLRQADIAMYRAKAAGGHAVQFYAPHMQAAIDERVALESEIQMGLRQQEFELYYQPQVDLAGDSVAAEALLRWRHPRRGLVCPDQFIPVAETSGLIVPLGVFVVRAACHQLSVWSEDAAMARIAVAVNVSVRQFHHPDFVDEVCAALDATGVDAGKLVLELTESVLLDCVEDVAARMIQLRSRGVRFSLDDFGTGYSSLYYLKRLPIDQLKIDQRFVADALNDANDLAIVRTIIALAQGLGLRVIAEGVETQAASGFLLAHQCHLQQGFLFSEPLPTEAFEQFMRAQRMVEGASSEDAACGAPYA